MNVVHDPLGELASPTLLRQTWQELFEYPIKLASGEVFQFDQVSERLMRKTLSHWGASGFVTIAWRLLDNSEVVCDQNTLQQYFDELEAAQVARGAQIDLEYVALKQSPTTLRDVANWKQSYLY